MKRYLIGKKQADNSYVYVNSISFNNIGVTSITEGGVDFRDKQLALAVCDYLNATNDSTYIVLETSITVKEVVK